MRGRPDGYELAIPVSPDRAELPRCAKEARPVSVGSNPDFLLGAARPLPPSADIGPGGQSVGQAAQFCLARVVLRQLFAGGQMIHRDGDEAAIADEVDEN